MRWPISNMWDTPAKHSGQEHAGNCPSKHWKVGLPQGGCNGEEGCCAVDAAHLPGPSSAGTLHPQTLGHVGGTGARQAQSRSR